MIVPGKSGFGCQQTKGHNLRTLTLYEMQISLKNEKKLRLLFTLRIGIRIVWTRYKFEKSCFNKRKVMVMIYLKSQSLDKFRGKKDLGNIVFVCSIEEANFVMQHMNDPYNWVICTEDEWAESYKSFDHSMFDYADILNLEGVRTGELTSADL